MKRCAWFLVALAACAGGDAKPPPQKPAAAAIAPAPPAQTQHGELGLEPGETMGFELELAGVTAGEAQLAVGQVGDQDGHKAIVVTSRAATSGVAAMLKQVTDQSTTVIDADTGRPLQLDTHVDTGGVVTTGHATFAGSVATVTYSKQGDDHVTSYTVDFGQVPVHDTHSAMAELRGWHGARGQQHSVYVVGGKRLWRIDVKVAGTESIDTQLGGRRRAVKLEGAAFHVKKTLELESAAPARTFTVWLSDDADRVPLKVTAKTELGDVGMLLVDYNRP